MASGCSLRRCFIHLLLLVDCGLIAVLVLVVRQSGGLRSRWLCCSILLNALLRVRWSRLGREEDLAGRGCWRLRGRLASWLHLLLWLLLWRTTTWLLVCGRLMLLWLTLSHGLLLLLGGSRALVVAIWSCCTALSSIHTICGGFIAAGRCRSPRCILPTSPWG